MKMVDLKKELNSFIFNNYNSSLVVWENHNVDVSNETEFITLKLKPLRTYKSDISNTSNGMKSLFTITVFSDTDLNLYGLVDTIEDLFLDADIKSSRIGDIDVLDKGRATIDSKEYFYLELGIYVLSV